MGASGVSSIKLATDPGFAARGSRRPARLLGHAIGREGSHTRKVSAEEPGFTRALAGAARVRRYDYFYDWVLRERVP